LYCIVSLPGGAFTAAGAGVKTNLLFFTKGKRTEKIWYYDLSDIKIGKKSPLTLDKFDEFFRLLPNREDSEKSWTIDFAARRETARTQAEPFKQKVRELENEAYKTKEKVKHLKQQSPQNKKEIGELLTKVAALDFQAREHRAKAETIENVIYDVKAVNPNAKDTTDKRPPKELLAFIAEKSREVEIALSDLINLS